ncbi:MAG: hypothetical protein R2825_12910 [Saprospiraceae bacterium]
MPTLSPVCPRPFKQVTVPLKGVPVGGSHGCRTESAASTVNGGGHGADSEQQRLAGADLQTSRTPLRVVDHHLKRARWRPSSTKGGESVKVEALRKGERETPDCSPMMAVASSPLHFASVELVRKTFPNGGVS